MIYFYRTLDNSLFLVSVTIKQAMKAIARKCQSYVFIMSFWGNCYFLNGKIVLCKANNRLKF